MIHRPSRILVLLLLLGGSLPVFAQNVTEQQVKWSFMIGLTRFIGWPQEFPNNTFEFCIIGETGYEQNHYSTERYTVKGAQVKKSIFTKVLPTFDMVQSCNAIYFSESLADTEINFFLKYLRDQPVLTISSRGAFSRYGGMVQFVTVDRKLRFKLNLESTREAELSVHPSLIKLALPGDS